MSTTSVHAVGLALVGLIYLSLRRRTWRGPCFVEAFCVAWGTLVVLGQLMPGDIYKVRAGSLAMLYGAWVAFLLGAMVAIRRDPDRVPVPRIRRGAALSVFWIILLMHVLVAIVMSWKTGVLGSLLGPAGVIDALVSARLDERTLTVHLGWYFELFRHSGVYLMPLALLLRREGLLSRGVVWGTLAICLAIATLNFSRIPILLVLVATLVPWLLLESPSPARSRAVLGAILASFLVFFSVMQSVLYGLDRTYSGGSTVVQQVGQYIFAPARAWEMVLDGNYPVEVSGYYTLEGVYYFLGKVGLIDPSRYPEWRREFVGVPYQTNVYTFLDAFTLDFGVPGAIVGSVVLGALCAAAHRWAWHRPSFLSLVVLSLMVFCCLVAPLANQFIKSIIPILLIVPAAVQILIGRRRTRDGAGVGTVPEMGDAPSDGERIR